MSYDDDSPFLSSPPTTSLRFTASSSPGALEDVEDRFATDASYLRRLSLPAPHWLGWKTLGTVYSCAFIANVSVGNWVLTFPSVFAVSGWLLPLLILVTTLALSVANCAMLAEVVRKVRGNQHFRAHASTSHLLWQFLPYPAAVVLQGTLLLFLASSLLALAPTLVAASDEAVALLGGRSCFAVVRASGATAECPNITWAQQAVAEWSPQAPSGSAEADRHTTLLLLLQS
eukprot:TRINITY_DN8365_c0_g1_i1.p2 TRINITY_DN8365_c0_g1~~TRINITY_DN8365_c0_g1_i1.p2  ORF type:complete len:230 (-),score=19.71 TRINITY_DN8365_c0_g1_i1:2648-3337(-)